MRPGPDDLAAICFTSGSSGSPKGVAWSHRGLLHWVRVFTDTVRITPADRIVLLFSAGVSASWRAIYSALLNGASLHILPPLGLGLPALIEQIRARGITIYHSVPALMRRICDALPDGERLDTVRVVCIGGDRVQWSDVDLCRRAFARDVLAYSILTSTECGPFIHGFVDDALRATTAHPPTGRAAPGWTVTVANDDGEPVADGATGELVVTSRFNAIGYWDGASLQVRPFPADPADPRLRIYRSGDLALRRPDGLIEFIGRQDQQIKLSGHRIELGDVESALKSCHGVRDAAVIAALDEAGLPQRLVAYCEVEPAEAEVSPSDLNAMLVDVLPLFMVPRTIRILDALPRLPNLKIDREELRRHDQREQERLLALRMISSEKSATFRDHATAPATVSVESGSRMQATLLRLWRDVLDRQDIGIDDDFFLCGGDSLAAIDLLHRVEEALQYKLLLSILVAAPTVRRLAARLETAASGLISNTIGIHASGSRRPLFVVHGIFGHATSLLPVLRSLDSDQPSYALQPPGMGWIGAGCTTLAQAAAHWIGEIKAIQPHGPYRLLGTSFGGLAVFEMAMQLQEMGETVDYLAMVDTHPPTCRFGDRLDVWEPRGLVFPARAGPIEALHQRIGETHLRMMDQYILDSRKLFRGELTYVCCTGNPVIAGRDRRRLWQHFATRFRLHQLPTNHDILQRGPHLAAFIELLSASLESRQAAGIDPAKVYDPGYRIGTGPQRGSIVGSTGDVYRIEQERMRGYVDAVRTDAETIQFMGWAVEPDRRQPAQTIAVFLGDRFLGYGTSCTPRLDVAKRLGPSAHYAGFDLVFPTSAASAATDECRLFVLSQDGRAAELRKSFSPGSASYADAARALWQGVRTAARRRYRRARSRS